MKTRHALLALFIALILAPVVLPLGAWFLLLLAPATMLVLPVVVFFAFAALPTLIVATHHREPTGRPRPPVSNEILAT